MVVVDGSQGEGGGQIFRTSLTLAMQLGQPVQIKNIRVGRAKPGLLRQHLTCLRAAQTVCGAEVSGAKPGSTEVIFKPGKVEAGEYRFAIGSAGSTTLVLQTVLLPLFFAERSSELYLEGGTHNGFAPSYDFIERCFLPAIRRMGYQAEVALERFGFYPSGGGAWRILVEPVQELQALALTERGEVLSRQAVATSAHIPKHVTERELGQVQKRCYWASHELQQRLVDSAGPGNILSLQVASEQVTEVVEVVGEKQVTAERVAGRAIQRLKSYLDSGVPVGEYLADQLLLPMVCGNGGQFRTLTPSQHLLTNIEVIKQLAGVKVTAQQESKRVWRISV
ncbi:RNA 3'-terminal phosphate cyclase [Marinobacterium zhoushanense]|uniref:RNA 3'-terminal phosphate cyclase n=1 Tax=Marinobacterium zhoushanense TaxID=1679163 RepID=A0ABQ1KJ27_9GAMM|nr:RNA 3'-terminal phosphate cyclase [Marinobacterium zhoushanense]GGB99158.1 RNA 3'-terminal phosphate cyclase [Marinobacterium zhoushanense]